MAHADLSLRKLAPFIETSLPSSILLPLRHPTSIHQLSSPEDQQICARLLQLVSQTQGPLANPRPLCVQIRLRLRSRREQNTTDLSALPARARTSPSRHRRLLRRRLRGQGSLLRGSSVSDRRRRWLAHTCVHGTPVCCKFISQVSSARSSFPSISNNQTVQAPSYSDCLECRTQQGALGQILDKCRMLFPVDRPSAISTFQPVTNVSASATVSASTSASASETASPGSEDPSSTTTHGATSTTSPGAVAGSGTTIASSVASDTSTIATKTDYESKSVPSYFPQTLSPPPSGSGTGTASTDAASAARAAGPVLGVLALAAAVGTVATLL